MPAMMTVPLDMAWSGVPVGAPTSRPSWVLPHRGPYPEVMFHRPMGRVQRLAWRSLFAAARALASAAFVRAAVAAASFCARAAATAAVRLASRAARCVASARPWRALASIVAACRRAARSATCASSAASSACRTTRSSTERARAAPAGACWARPVTVRPVSIAAAPPPATTRAATVAPGRSPERAPSARPRRAGGRAARWRPAYRPLEGGRITGGDLGGWGLGRPPYAGVRWSLGRRPQPVDDPSTGSDGGVCDDEG